MRFLFWDISLPKLFEPEEDVWQSLWRCSVAEFMGTMIFVFLGTGSVVAAQAAGKESLLINGVTLIILVALAHGFAITITIYTIGEVSGGNINPAVTWALVLTRKMSCVRGLVFVISQLLGALLASAVLKSLLPPAHESFLGCHTLDPQLSLKQGLSFEIVLTFIFVFVVFATAVSPFVGKMAPLSGAEYGPGKLTPLALGLTILVLHCVGVPFTGASMNPARSFGPAVIRGDECLNNHWIYWVGPLLGSTCSAIIAQTIFLSNPESLAKAFSITRGDHDLANLAATGGKKTAPTADKTQQPAAADAYEADAAPSSYGRLRDDTMEELDIAK